MIRFLKQKLYFLWAGYFKFWAQWRLRLWHPFVIVVTASTGKTTLLHLLESQIGSRARYSHLANSAFGVPFHILGLERKTFQIGEWVSLFFQAPLALFRPVPTEKTYIVEADCDRPGEGAFLADLLRPAVTLWLNVSRTHTQNFDPAVITGKFPSIEKAVSYEFGHFLAATQTVGLVNGDSDLIAGELARARTKIVQFHQADWLTEYSVTEKGTVFTIAGQKHIFSGLLLPKDVWLSIALCWEVCQKLGCSYDFGYSKFTLPPGRSSVFSGLRHTTLIDSSYNSNYDSMRAMLELVQAMPAEKKWLVLGDMVELGAEEATEHERLGQLLATTPSTYGRIILIGPRLQKFTLPIVQHLPVAHFLQPADALAYLQQQLQGGETILFKGSRFLEGIIEHLLADKKEARHLCRRELVWQKRRRQWGL